MEEDIILCDITENVCPIVQSPGLPCSVIIANHDNQFKDDNLIVSASQLMESTEYIVDQVPVDLSSLPVVLSETLTDIPTRSFMLVSSFENTSLKNSDKSLGQRNRRIKRPYSPEAITLKNKKVKLIDRKVKEAKQMENHVISTNLAFNSKPFSCEKCKSPFIVDPSRSRLPFSKSKRKPGARKIVDSVTNKVLIVCNACGLATGRKHVKPILTPPPTAEEKADYLKESTLFAKSLAESLQEPDADRLYCPAYKTKPCRCLQNFIIGSEIDGRHNRALNLLMLLNEAKLLIKQKDVADFTEDKVVNKQSKTHQTPKGIKLRRSRAFEEFVLSKRIYLRDSIGLCERACQRILLYSNNFLHKKVKSAPNKGPRAERVIGRNACGLLKPILELSHYTCCLDNCVVLALTHSKLLESWRYTSGLGQRQARRVLAEMLTPTGGTKANCFKFIAMVTGCSYSTISSVNEHMKHTQGDREPAEHGMKRWWREQARMNERETEEEDVDDPPCLSDVHIPTHEELQTMSAQEAALHLDIQREKLVLLQKQLANQQLMLEQQCVLLNKSPKKRVCTVSTSSESKELRSHQLQVLELPRNHSGATPISNQMTPSPPTLSVMPSISKFEPLGSIGISLPESRQTKFTNVVIIPEHIQNR